MQIAEILLLVMWTLAGFFVSLGCITNNPKLRVQSLFTIENRWGQLCIGLILLAFVIIRVYQWQHSPTPYIIWKF